MGGTRVCESGWRRMEVPGREARTEVPGSRNRQPMGAVEGRRNNMREDAISSVYRKPREHMGTVSLAGTVVGGM